MAKDATILSRAPTILRNVDEIKKSSPTPLATVEALSPKLESFQFEMPSESSFNFFASQVKASIREGVITSSKDVKSSITEGNISAKDANNKMNPGTKASFKVFAMLFHRAAGLCKAIPTPLSNPEPGLTF